MLVGALWALACPAAAQDEETPDDQLTASRLLSDPNEVTAPIAVRPQLVQHDRMTKGVMGFTTGLVGASTLVASWAIYAARQTYRLRPWSQVNSSVNEGFESRGTWAMWLGLGSSAHFVAAEYLLLPEARAVPTLAWFAGGMGLVTAGVGLAFTLGGDHCGPQPYAPGGVIIRSCESAISDALFGPMLMFAAVPLLNVPVTYLLRSVLADTPTSLSVTPHGLSASFAF
jgi:hypothetical protein